MNPMLVFALRTAAFELIGFHLPQLVVAAGLLAIAHSIDGELAGFLVILTAVATGALTFYCLRETAQGRIAPLTQHCRGYRSGFGTTCSVITAN
jgi:hypothetical protein